MNWVRSFAKLFLSLSLFVSLWGCASSGGLSAGGSQSLQLPELAYEKFQLDNGLTVIVHEDHKAPLVAVNLWYHVGSKDEKPGKTGFAHLFEHLMFNGSEHYDDEFFRPLEAVGATGMNGTTNEDRTNYFETVPKNALDRVLWMESDRMGHLLGAITQAKLDEQRGVVQNEKRQRESQPYGKVWNAVIENSYPAGHPYSWPVIGSMADLDAASLDDVHQWFKDWYGPNNAVLVIAGDVDVATAKQKVEHYFGNFKASAPLQRNGQWIAELPEARRLHLQDRVPQARLYKVWNVPPATAKATDQLQVIGDLLTSGKSSRLYQRLVRDEQVATSVSVYLDARELGSQFIIIATAQEGVNPATLETAIDEEMQRLFREGPSADELERIRTGYYSSTINQFQRIGGFGGKTDLLASSEVYYGRPDGWRDALNNVLNTDAAAVKRTGSRWLGENALSVSVTPYAEYGSTATDAKRDGLPAVGEFPDLKLPELQRFTLSNGLPVILAERKEAPLVQMQLLARGGFAADSLATPGTASMTMAMLDEGIPGLDALELANELERLGAGISASAALDYSSISLGALSNKLHPALALYADVVRKPSLPQAELDRLKPRWLAKIKQEKAQPVGMVLRTLPPLVFGSEHVYGQPLSGSGTEAAVAAMTTDDLRAYHQQWIRPDNASLLVVGDINAAELQTELERVFGDWQAPATAIPRIQPSPVAAKTASQVYLIDRPETEQSMVIAGHIAPGKRAASDIPLEVLNTVLGGMFTARLNMNLREDKHWSYGAGSFLMDTQAQRLWGAYASVQTDKTSESMREILKEIRAIRGTRPPSQTEITQAQNNLTLKLPGQSETNSEVAGLISQLLQYDLPDDYYASFVSKVRQTNRQQLRETGQNILQPEQLVWIVVGDLSKIEQKVRQLKLGEVRVLDADGNVLR